MDTIEETNEKLKNFKWFIGRFIQPFFAPIFTVLNYFSLTEGEIREKFWGNAFLLVSIIYFVISLGLAIYQVVNYRANGKH